MNILIYIGIILFIGSIVMLARAILRIPKLEVENERLTTELSKTFERFTHNVILHGKTYRIQWVSYYIQEDDDKPRINSMCRTMERILAEHNFGLPTFNENLFRSDTADENLYNVVMREVDN